MHKFLWPLLPAVALVACAAPPRGEPSPGAVPPAAAAKAAQPAPAGQAWHGHRVALWRCASTATARCRSWATIT